MTNFEELKKHYKFTPEEAQLLKKFQGDISKLQNEFIEEFYDYIWGFGTTAKFLKNTQIIEYHKAKLKEWFVNLFSGSYGVEYFTYLYKIGEIHVRIGLPTHFVNSAFTFVRTYTLKKIDEMVSDQAEYTRVVQAVEKIIDINLDVLTSSYREEELGKFLSMSRFEKTILQGLKKFNSYVNLFLAFSLAIVAFFAIGLFVYDIYLLVFTPVPIEEGILTVLGSLLVLWAAIELIHEEINHLQGRGFAIGAFIMLAMAALIRKVLIYSLSSEKINELLTVGTVIVALGIAYWLIGGKAKAKIS
ncbi:MAG: protoglobin domain-containing protein [Sulfuricurvum sp.]